MTPEEDELALRRIREAVETGAAELDLSWFSTLNRLPPELERLNSLRSLNLCGCRQLSGDLSPLADLTKLQSLNLAWCGQLSGDLSPLAGLPRTEPRRMRPSQRPYSIGKLTALQWLRQISKCVPAG
jgi:hypothetical protein